jgi:hypothetical protein
LRLFSPFSANGRRTARILNLTSGGDLQKLDVGEIRLREGYE